VVGGGSGWTYRRWELSRRGSRENEAVVQVCGSVRRFVRMVYLLALRIELP